MIVIVAAPGADVTGAAVGAVVGAVVAVAGAAVGAVVGAVVEVATGCGGAAVGGGGVGVAAGAQAPSTMIATNKLATMRKRDAFIGIFPPLISKKLMIERA